MSLQRPRTWGTNQPQGVLEMSQVDAFNDNVTDTTATQPFTALAKPPQSGTDGSSRTRNGEGPGLQLALTPFCGRPKVRMFILECTRPVFTPEYKAKP
jgi:hypothetical protein